MFFFISWIQGFGQINTTVKVSADRTNILIGEQIQLIFEASIPEQEPIRFFNIDSIDHFEILEKNKIDTSNTPGGTILRQRLLVTSFDSGHWVIPRFFLYENLYTDSIAVDVGFSAFDPQQDYHDIKGIIEVNPEDEKKQWWFYAAGAFVLLVLILIFLLRKKKKTIARPQVVQIDSYKEAMEQLEKIRKNKPAPKEYYSRLVDIFRLYIFRKKGILSLQKTTDDLVLQLKKIGLNNEQHSELSQALKLSDYVKFAKYDPEKKDDIIIFEVIKSSIESIERIN